jgi:hypothetical protein
MPVAFTARYGIPVHSTSTMASIARLSGVRGL